MSWRPKSSERVAFDHVVSLNGNISWSSFQQNKVQLSSVYVVGAIQENVMYVKIALYIYSI